MLVRVENPAARKKAVRSAGGFVVIGVGKTETVDASKWTEVELVVELIREINGATYELQIGSPCLRGDVADGAEVRHVARGLFEAVEDTGGQPVYDGNWCAKVQVELREALRL